MIPLTRKVKNNEVELDSLETLVSERTVQDKEVADKIAVYNAKLRFEYQEYYNINTIVIFSHLKDRITSLSNLPMPLTITNNNKMEDDIFSSTPPIVPALVVSTALNLLTGATFLSKFLVSSTTNTAKMDTVEPPVNVPRNYQYISR